MRLVLYIAAVVLLRLPNLAFKQSLREAALAGRSDDFASLRRWRAIVFLIVWILMAIWLHFLPDYEGWRNWIAWAIVGGALIYGFVDLRLSTSIQANQRYAKKLVLEKP